MRLGKVKLSDSYDMPDAYGASGTAPYRMEQVAYTGLLVWVYLATAASVVKTIQAHQFLFLGLGVLTGMPCIYQQRITGVHRERVGIWERWSWLEQCLQWT